MKRLKEKQDCGSLLSSRIIGSDTLRRRSPRRARLQQGRRPISFLQGPTSRSHEHFPELTLVCGQTRTDADLHALHTDGVSQTAEDMHTSHNNNV